MRSRWLAIGGFAAAIVVALTLQQQRLNVARDAARVRHERQREVQALAAENARLRAVQPSADDAATLARERQELARLHVEVARLKKARAALPALDAPKNPAAGNFARPELWQNVGAGTPEAALETALWAATGGELDTLAGLLLLEGDAKVRADALLAKLPATLRADYPAPERLVALLAAKDVAVAPVQLWRQTADGPDRTVLFLTVANDRGELRPVSLNLRRADAGWRLVVPTRAIARYAAQLAGEAP